MLIIFIVCHEGTATRVQGFNVEFVHDQCVEKVLLEEQVEQHRDGSPGTIYMNLLLLYAKGFIAL